MSWLLLLIVGLYAPSGPLPADQTAPDPVSTLARVEPPPGTLPVFFLEGTRLARSTAPNAGDAGARPGALWQANWGRKRGR